MKKGIALLLIAMLCTLGISAESGDGYALVKAFSIYEVN